MKKISVRFLFLIALVFALSSCNSRVDKNLGVKFIDDAKLYSENFKQEIINGKYHFPNGVPIVIMTIDTIPISEMGFFGNDILENSSKWFESKKERKNCVFLIISKNPKLIQMRFGENVLLEAYRHGLSTGNKYRAYQESFIANGFEKGLSDILKNLETELPLALDISWIMRIQKPGAKIAFKEMSDLSMPSDGAYTNIIFRPYSRLIKTLSFFPSPLFLIIINAILLLLIVKTGKLLIIKLLGTKSLKKLTSILLVVWGLISSIFFSIPFWGSIVFLSSMRIEDSMFAQYMQIPLLEITKNSFWYSSYTQIWLALIIGILVFVIALPTYYFGAMAINYLMSSNDEDFKANLKSEMDDSFGEVINQSFGKGIRFAFFTLFMPRAISLLVLIYFLLQLPSAIKGYIKWEKLKL